ncbi:MAG: HD-GYP domain-containing protein [Leptospirales bacterium]|nr:HD-GYP domain-containing protein [Leptospirales bacterium]
MAKHKILVEDLKIGMSFDQPVYIDSDELFLQPNTPISEQDIKKLMVWGVAELVTSGQTIESQAPPEPEVLTEAEIIRNYKNFLKKRKSLITLYQKAISAVENVHENIHQDQSFGITEIESSVVDIIKILKENRNIFLFLYGLDGSKSYLVNHSVNVTFYAIITGLAMNYSLDVLKELGVGTMLIDAGMIKVPMYILRKQSNLTEHEFKQIKTHPVLGYKAVRELGKVSELSAEVSLQHHEQFDGKGYPRGLRGNDISEFARIASIADSYEAQITSRSYKKKIFFYQAMRNLISSAVNKFDPLILKTFLVRMSVYPIGSIVVLNDKSIGIVISSSTHKPLRPILKLVSDSNGKRVQELVIVNLIEKTSLYITSVVDEDQANISIFDVL